ncbi:sporulation/spore germination protein [Chrysosporum bergii ANA360D]|jgi:hypothetical protein|uniref:Sporulation/spore germination protein n=1 Tax=Chrysosporum bergii ANA360D TaxID=617107 RepID=A0AA43GQZ4_9CYAN|nr:sporulation/spore germination protein [Chrysosporum bergii]MDH6060114.1 sporulation/spore germination protein [Chrysosporum bergii ANA360D]
MKIKTYLLPLILVAIGVNIISCSSNPRLDSTSINSETPSSVIPPSAASKTPFPTSLTPNSQTINVILYTIDSECQQLMPEPVSVPAEEPITGAVGKIIKRQDTADFDLSGYRVQVENGIATVDFRLSPVSKRQFVSLSSCEQLALFGSLRKTLVSNAEWNIKEVRFTEQGKKIII